MQTKIDHCWNEIGVSGDGSCPQLKTAIHCRNCSVYVSAGRTLLQREAPLGYVEEWITLLAKQASEENLLIHHSHDLSHDLAKDVLSLMIFRVGDEWLALPVEAIKEITQPCPIHILPHRSNHVFLGIVNIRGEILMGISLSNLLSLSRENYGMLSSPTNSINPVVYSRMVVIEIQENRWVFPVDEIAGVHRFSGKDLRDAPVVISKTPDTYTKKIIDWYERKVNYLDHELLFYELLFYTLNRA